MVEPLRHRQTKGAETDMPGLPPPRHIPTLPVTAIAPSPAGGPRYLHRFATERTVSIDTTAAGGNASLLALEDEA